MGAPDSQTFNHLQHTVRLHVVVHLHLATGPLKLDLTNDAVGAQSEMDSFVRRADVSHGCGDVVELDAPGTTSQLDSRPNTIAVAGAAFGVDQDPVIGTWRRIEQNGRGLADGRDNYIDAAVIIQVREGAAAMSARDLEGWSCLGRHEFEAAATDI